MTDEDFVGKILDKQKNTRADIRALKEEIDHVRGVVDKMLELQQAQDERESQQAAIAADVTKIASSVVGLVEDMHAQNQELTGHIRELRLSTAADATLENLIVKIKGAGMAIDETPPK